jgi:DNA topoisomerase IB
MAGVAREVAKALGNTPAVCRKSYIDPRIFDRFEHGETIEAVVSDVPRGLDELSTRVRSRIERAVVELLEGSEPSAEIAVA